MKRKIIFIDRDGTLNIDRGYVYRIEDFEFIPGSLEGLKLLSDYPCILYIITNQAGIAKGLFTEDDFNCLNQYMLKQFELSGIRIEGVLFCPHHPKGKVKKYRRNCQCRKPEIGLVKPILSKFPAHEYYFIGDKDSDILCGKKINALTYLVETGYGQSKKKGSTADYVVKNFYKAVLHILNNKPLPAGP